MGVVDQFASDPAYTAALAELSLTPQEQYMFRHHLGNLYRGGVQQPTGQVSTYLGSTFDVGGRHYMLPTVWDNQIVAPDAAFERARAAGMENWPSYGSEQEAEQRYEQIHGYMERGAPSKPDALGPGGDALSPGDGLLPMNDSPSQGKEAR